MTNSSPKKPVGRLPADRLCLTHGLAQFRCSSTVHVCGSLQFAAFGFHVLQGLIGHNINHILRMVITILGVTLQIFTEDYTLKRYSYESSGKEFSQMIMFSIPMTSQIENLLILEGEI